MIPSDCTDGFGCAYWNRPEVHLDPVVLAAMSRSSQLAPEVLAEGVEHLRADLETGRWDQCRCGGRVAHSAFRDG
jgi:hypothetical protein